MRKKQSDYSSDRESDRDGIIIQVDLNGKLRVALNEFANVADNHLRYVRANESIAQLIEPDGYYITFNYKRYSPFKSNLFI